MPVYRSPIGVLYNLDNFVKYEVTTETVDGPISRSISKLIATTESKSSFVLFNGTKEECEQELYTIHRTLTLPVPVKVALDRTVESFLRRKL